MWKGVTNVKSNTVANEKLLMLHMTRAMRKRVLFHMRTTNAQISLRIGFDRIVSLDSIAEISRL